LKVPRIPTFGALFSFGLLLYAPRAYRVLAVAGDSAELTTAAALWGVPHPPGYPLYTFVGHLVTLLPIDPALAMHLLSALLHAAALGFVGCAIERFTGSVVAAAIGAGTLAFGRVFFLGSLYAEVFPLNELVFACLLWLAARRGPWPAMALVLGLGLAHHPMIVLAVPALALLVRERPPKGLRLAVLAVASPVAAYALVPLAASREPYLSWGDVHDLGSLVHLVTRQDYGGPLRASRQLADGQLFERLDAFSAATFSSFGAAGSLLVAAGAVAACRRDRRTGIALLAAALLTGPIFATANAFDLHSVYRVAFFERFFGMSHVALAVLAGFGVAGVEPWLGARPLGRVALAALAILTLGPLVPNVAKLDVSSNRLGLAYAHDLVDSAPDGALVLLKGDMPTQAALYTCGVERRCGDRIVLAPGQLAMPWYRRQVERRYPALELAADGDVGSLVAHLVEHELPRRPVLVHEELLDQAASGPRAALPSGLLFRIYPTTDAAIADRPRFEQDLAATARRLVPASPHPLDDQLVRAYESARRAHAIAARELGLDAHL
jgi:hypothetical protein